MYAVGDYLANSSGQILKVIEIVARDPRWKCAGYRVVPGHTGYGDGSGMSKFLADYIASDYAKVIPGEWAPVIGGDLEFRWVCPRGTWSRELRKTP